MSPAINQKSETPSCLTPSRSWSQAWCFRSGTRKSGIGQLWVVSLRTWINTHTLRFFPAPSIHTHPYLSISYGAHFAIQAFYEWNMKRLLPFPKSSLWSDVVGFLTRRWVSFLLLLQHYPHSSCRPTCSHSDSLAALSHLVHTFHECNH